MENSLTPAPASRTPRHHALLHSGDVQIEVIVEGDGPAVVLLPSSQRDATDFDEVAAGLAQAGLKVLRPRPRGMGRSRGPMDRLTLHELARDVALAITECGDGRAVVVGHAFGHFVARVLDLDQPGLVRGVAVAAAAARVFPAGMSASLDIASDASRPEEERLRHLQKAFFAPGNDPAGWLKGWHPELRDIYRAAGTVPPKDAWWKVTHSPILDLQAGADPWRPRDTINELKDALGDIVTVCTINNASHALFDEQPAAVVDAIVKWIATLED